MTFNQAGLSPINLAQGMGELSNLFLRVSFFTMRIELFLGPG
jgi:hypothetical protein